MAENSKYIPLKDIGIGGIIVMRYGQTDQPEELVEPVAGRICYLGVESVKILTCRFIMQPWVLKWKKKPSQSRPSRLNTLKIKVASIWEGNYWKKKKKKDVFRYIMVLYWICGMCAAALLKCREKCEIRSRLCPPFLALRSIHFETILIILPVLNQRLRATPRQENANEVGFEETDDVTGIR